MKSSHPSLLSDQQGLVALFHLSPGGAVAIDHVDRGGSEGAPAERLGVRVFRRYRHQADAFTQGLVWHDGDLYERTGIEGHSSLRLVDLDTGRSCAGETTNLPCSPRASLCPVTTSTAYLAG